jgi:anti-sigma regulatory factor (Ser/Thr protein kinase)
MVVYDGRFRSENVNVKHIVMEVLSRVKDAAPYMTTEVEFDLRFVFCELLINAMQHGNKSSGGRHVSMTVSCGDEHLTCTIRDEGKGFDHRNWFARSGDRSRDALASEHGRGVILSSALADHLSYNEKGNEVTVRKRLKPV